MSKIIKFTLGALVGLILVSYHAWSVESNYENGYETGVAYEQALEAQCRKEVGNDYDKMSDCIESYYGTEDAETLVPFKRGLTYRLRLRSFIWHHTYETRIGVLIWNILPAWI